MKQTHYIHFDISIKTITERYQIETQTIRKQPGEAQREGHGKGEERTRARGAEYRLQDSKRRHDHDRRISLSRRQTDGGHFSRQVDRSPPFLFSFYPPADVFTVFSAVRLFRISNAIMPVIRDKCLAWHPGDIGTAPG